MQTGIFTLCRPGLLFFFVFFFVALETWRWRAEPSLFCFRCHGGGVRVQCGYWQNELCMSRWAVRGEERVGVGGLWTQERGSVRCREVGTELKKWRIRCDRAAGWTLRYVVFCYAVMLILVNLIPDSTGPDLFVGGMSDLAKQLSSFWGFRNYSGLRNPSPNSVTHHQRK